MRTYKSITVGVDFSPVSHAALFHAARIAGRSRAPLTAAHIVDEALAHRLAQAGPVNADREDDTVLLDDFRRRLAAMAAQNAPDADIAFEVAIDRRAAGLLRIAERQGCDLLVVGNPDDRRAGIGDLLRSCVRQSPADTLIVRDGGYRPFRRIVAAVDFEPDSAGVLQRAANLATHDAAELIVAFVHEESALSALFARFGGEPGSQQNRERADIVRSRLAEMARPFLDGLPEERVSFHVELDDSYPVRVSDLADEVVADLLVVGYRHHRWPRNAVTASTSEAVVEDSLFNVLVVKV